MNEFGHDRYVSIVTINLKHTDKAYAILELLMILNKKESDTIIFGDNYADINMLKLNGITVAMAMVLLRLKKLLNMLVNMIIIIMVLLYFFIKLKKDFKVLF